MKLSLALQRFFDFPLFGRVLAYARPYRRWVVGSLVLALALGILSPLRGLLIQYTVDKGLKHQPGNLPLWLDEWFVEMGKNDVVRFLVVITLVQIVVLVVESAARFGFSYITAWLGQHVVKDLRVAVFKKVLGLNLRQFDTTPIGTLTTRTINDIESINEIFSDGLIPIIADFLVIVFTLGVMFWVDWQLTLICLIPFPLLLLATWIFKEAVNKSFMTVRSAVSQLNAFVQEHLSGMQLVQVFTAEKSVLSAFRQINKVHRDANIAAIFAYSVFFPVVEVVLAVSLGLLVWWVADQRLEAGKLIAFILFLNQIFRPLRVIADKFNVIQMGMVASERVFKVLDNNDVLPPAPNNAYNPSTVKGHIQFQEVGFAYETANPVLQNVSFEVTPGKTLAIVGSTGSGKTTIISLLNRLYAINDGAILIDGVPIEQWEIERLRSQIGVVLQDVFLFAGSISDNLTLSNPSIPHSRVEEVCRLIGLHAFIMQLPGQYQYNVMERGATLSAGQRQLLSFARCLLYNPAILVLDEATSNIDSESEQLIQKAIDQLTAGRTSIIIAHRLSTVRKAHQLMVLDKGRVVEMGTHEALLQQNGHYAALQAMQMHQDVAGV